MKLILNGQTPDDFRFAAQLGVDGVVSQMPIEQIPHGYYEYPRLVTLKSEIEAYGLTLEGFSLLPWSLCYKWMLGLPGRDEQIENTLTSLRNLGAAGVPLVVFNMHALRFYRTSTRTPARGGSWATSFQYARVADAPLWAGGAGADTSIIPDELKRPLSDDDMWANYTYFIKAAVPVAEEAGVRLALHPDDPQVPQIGGVARIMREPDAFRKALAIAPSEALGLKYCTGCYAQMGADQVKEITYWGERNKIFLVDFRNIIGQVDDFREAYLDNGKEDMYVLMQALYDAGYDGPIGPDHAVHLSDDGPKSRQYWAYAVGYMRALMRSVAD